MLLRPCPELVLREGSPARAGCPSLEPQAPVAPRQASWAGVPGSSRAAAITSWARAAVDGAVSGVGERLPTGRRVGAQHLLSCRRRRRASWRRRIHPDLLGKFRAWVVLQSARTQLLNLFFYFPAGAVRSGQPGSHSWVGMGMRTAICLWVMVGRGTRSPRSTAISIFPLGRRDLARTRVTPVGGVRPRAHSLHCPLAPSPPALTPTPRQVAAPPPPR